MADIVSPEMRSRMMAGIRGKNTRPELFLRRGLHRLGFRFRLHRNDLPGKPDLVFPRHRAVLFAHGCFWHGHDCHLFKWPRSRPDFWRKKIEENRQRDQASAEALLHDSWRVGTVWECALKGKHRRDPQAVLNSIEEWLLGNGRKFSIADCSVQKDVVAVPND